MIKKRIILALLTLSLILSFVTPVSFASTEDVSLTPANNDTSSKYDIYPVSLIAEETISSEDYSKGKANTSDTTGVNNVNIVNTYTDASVSTGTGWNGNWLVKDSDDTDYRVPVDADNVLYSLSADTETPVVHVKGMTAGTTLYRLLKTPINFKDTYGKYIFSVDVKNGLSSSKSNFRFNIGNLVTLGYNKTSATEGTLVVEAGGTSFPTEVNVVLGPETTNANNNYYLHFEAEICLEENGEDAIKISVTKRKNYNQIDSTAVTSEFAVSAELDGSVDYISFGAHNGTDATKSTYRFDNITISGVTEEVIDSMMCVKVLNGSFKSGDGIKLLDTSKITDSIVYDFELYNYYKTPKTAKVYLGVYYDDELAGVKALQATLPALTKVDNLSLGFEESLPDGDKSKISVRVFLWEGDTLVPLCDRIDMYSQDSRAVIPEIFGADTDDAVTVAFMGDSITHLNPSYAKWIEYYYRIKYPTKDIKFVSKGISGDKASGIEKRFDWDILNGYGTGTPTEACLMIGMNDVTRNLYPDGSDEDKQSAIDTCLENIEDIIELCEKNNIKLTLITPPLYDEAAYSSKANNVGVNETLGKIAEGVINLANEKNLAYIDFYGYINSFNSELRSTAKFATEEIFNEPDRIHPTPAGTFAEGFIFIAQQINNSVIASVDINAGTLDAKAENAEVTNVAYEDNILSYTYSPQSLPMYMTEEYILCNDTYGIPVTDSINREIIKITNLSEGNYKIMFGDSEIGTYSAKQLAEGVNIATVSANPGYVQSEMVYEKVTSKMAKDRILREIAYVERNVVGNVDDLTDVEACIAYVAEKYADSEDTRYINYASNKTIQETTVSEIAVLEAEAKTAAQPGSYSVQIIKQ